jgi:hypothetical protein
MISDVISTRGHRASAKGSQAEATGHPQMTGRIVAGCRGTTGCPLTAVRSNSTSRTRLAGPWDRWTPMQIDFNRHGVASGRGAAGWRPSHAHAVGSVTGRDCRRANVTRRGPRSVLRRITRARHGSKTNTPRISLVPRCSPLSAGQRAAAGSHRAPAGPGKSVLEPAQATTLT